MICPQFPCLFVHIPKTAGQSIERVFLQWAGYRWEQRAEFLLRPNDDPAKGPPRLAHLTAADYVELGYLSPEAFAAAFKFAFVRNPWARLVSIYHHLNKGEAFRAYVLGPFRKRVWVEMAWFVRPQYDFIFDASGQQLVDFVGRFEQLQADFDLVCQRLGMPPTPLPHVNRAADHRRLYWGPNVRRLLRSWRKRAQKSAPRLPHYRDYYDASTRALVEELYHDDIVAFQYRF